LCSYLAWPAHDFFCSSTTDEDVDVIQVVTPEEFIKEHMQETAESIFE
jgi:hypothetical protein